MRAGDKYPGGWPSLSRLLRRLGGNGFGFESGFGVYYGRNSSHFYKNYTDQVATERVQTQYSTSGSTVNETCQNLPFGDAFPCQHPQGGFGGDVYYFAGLFTDPIGTDNQAVAREYSATQGRWESPDPAGMAAVDPSDPQTWNRYAYVGNNPLSNVDPMGTRPCQSVPCRSYIDDPGSYEPGTNNPGAGEPSDPGGDYGGSPTGVGTGPLGGVDGSPWGCGSDFLPCGLPPVSAGPGLPCDFGVCNPIGNDFGPGTVAALGPVRSLDLARFLTGMLVGALDMWDNYTRMKQRNWVGDDLYYHCMGNCQATNVGPGGAFAAGVTSCLRTNIWGRLTEPDWRDDNRANKCGQQGGDCNRTCGPFVPPSSPGNPPFPGW